MMTREQLCEQLESQAAHLMELGASVAPLKRKNVRLSRMAHLAVKLVQEAAAVLRGFFADPGRRNWVKERKAKDKGLVDFLRVLITWYRRLRDDDSPTLSFYRRLWQYERGRIGETTSTSGPFQQLDGSFTKADAHTESSTQDLGPSNKAMYD